MTAATVRTVTYSATSCALVLAAAALFWTGRWPYGMALVTVAVLLFDASLFVHDTTTGGEDLAARIDSTAAAALAKACCETWWTSLGFHHSLDCPNHPKEQTT